MSSTPATPAQIQYARRLQAERSEQLSYDGAEEAWIEYRAGNIRIAILQGSTERPEYSQARDDLDAAQAAKEAERDRLFAHLPLLEAMKAANAWSRTQPRKLDPVQATALAQATADLVAHKAQLSTDPATLTKAEASALIDRLR